MTARFMRSLNEASQSLVSITPYGVVLFVAGSVGQVQRPTFCRTTGDRPCIPHIPPAGTNVIVGYSRARLKHCSLSTREEERETRTMSQEPQSQNGLAWPIVKSGNTHPPTRQGSPGSDLSCASCNYQGAIVPG